MLYDNRVGLPPPTPQGPAAWTVGAYLRGQLDELEAREPQVRRDEPDAVHKMRVAARRSRSALATYRPLLDRSASDRLREELRWLGLVLGEVRDAEVMAERLDLHAATAGSRSDEGPTALLRTHLADVRRTGQARVVDTLDDVRYSRLVADFESFVTDPPWTSTAQQPAARVLPPRVRQAWKLVRRRARAVGTARTPGERGERMHEVRKAAKRARYAAESLVPVYGEPARCFAEEMSALQDVLGAHQDSVVLEQLAADLGDEAMRASEHARQKACRAEYLTVWRQVSRKELRRWLRT